MRFPLLISALFLQSVLVAQAPPSSLQSQSPSPAAPGQQNPSSPPSQRAAQQGPGHVIHVPVEEVIVPVTVKDDRGALVTDLRRDEFRIFEDGIEQRINLFDQQAVPLSAVILVDNDLPVKTVEPVQRSLDTISAGFGPNDEAAIVTFDRFQKTVMGFTRSNDMVFTQLKRLQLGSTIQGSFAGPLSPGPPQINNRPFGGGAGVGNGTLPNVSVESAGSSKNIDDAVHYAAEMLRTRSRDRRKLIFLISDGNNSRHNQWSFNTTLNLLLASDISVYSVVVGLNPFHLEGQRMVHYATATGGDTYTGTKQQDLERLYGQITEQARNQYTLGYVPQRPSGNRTYHTIEVRIRRPGLKILARQGYYTAAVR